MVNHTIAIAVLIMSMLGSGFGQDCHVTTTLRFLNQREQTSLRFNADQLRAQIGGTPAKVVKFSSATRPTLILLLDSSGSMKGTWNQSIAAARQLASAAGDDVAVFVFREEIVATATGRAETEKLLDQLSTSTLKSGGTALYDTLIEVSGRIKTRNAAFVVIGDGEDNASRHSADAVIARFLQASSRPIFGLILNYEHKQKRLGNFQKIVDATGGILSLPSAASKVAADATALSTEISAPFTVTLQGSQPISRAAKLDIELVGPDNKPLQQIHVLHVSDVAGCDPLATSSAKAE